MEDQPARTIGPVSRAAGMGGALATLIAWGLSIAWGIDMPELVEVALAVVISGIGALVGGWLVYPGKGKRIK